MVKFGTRIGASAGFRVAGCRFRVPGSGCYWFQFLVSQWQVGWWCVGSAVCCCSMQFSGVGCVGSAVCCCGMQFSGVRCVGSVVAGCMFQACSVCSDAGWFKMLGCW